MPVYVPTFDLLHLPHENKAALLGLKVKCSVLSSRRYFCCQKFGHISNNFRKKIKAEKKIYNNCGRKRIVNMTDNHTVSTALKVILLFIRNVIGLLWSGKFRQSELMNIPVFSDRKQIEVNTETKLHKAQLT